MNGKTFVDTNVLVYAHDLDAGRRHHIAKLVLQELWEDGSGVLSPQVLQEFYVCVTGKIARRLSKKDARIIVGDHAAWSVDVSSAVVIAAFEIEDRASINFWDALIVASAIEAGATRLLTEDLNAGQIISGIRIENPFAGLLS